MSSTSPPASPRFDLIDALRGFALFGILLVNARDVLWDVWGIWKAPTGDITATVLDFSVQTRFEPIFATLFGVSMFFVLSGARTRHPRPWIPAARRFVALIVLGFAITLYSGNPILVIYAVVGLLALPLVMLTSKRMVLIVGAVVTVGLYAAGLGGLGPLGLIPLGYAASAYGVPALLERGDRRLLSLFTVCTALTVAGLAWQTTQPGDTRDSYAGMIAGGVMSLTYVLGFSLLWHTPARRGLGFFFEPLGRMALTNFAAAPVLVVASALVIDWSTVSSSLPLVGVAVLIIALQSVASRLWLRVFVYGPIEWLWRAATWWRVPVLLRRAARPRPA